MCSGAARVTIRPVRPRRVQTPLVLAVALAALGCHTTGAVYCPPPPTSGCPDGGGPNFAEVYQNVFHPVCDNCHSPDGGEPSKPLITYQQVYGKNGDEVKQIRNQVFYQCLMPPSNAPQPLPDAGRQVLWDWIACGAPDNPSADGGGAD